MTLLLNRIHVLTTQMRTLDEYILILVFNDVVAGQNSCFLFCFVAVSFANCEKYFVKTGKVFIIVPHVAKYNIFKENIEFIAIRKDR